MNATTAWLILIAILFSTTYLACRVAFAVAALGACRHCGYRRGAR